MLTKRLESAAFIALCGIVVFIPIAMSPFQICHAFFLIASLILFFSSNRKSEFAQPFFILIGLYLFCNALSLTQTQFMRPSIQGMTKVLRQILLCLAVYLALDTEKKFYRLFDCFLVVATIVGLDALLQRVTGIEVFRGRSMTPFVTQVGRLTGPFSHANNFSAYLSLVIFLFLGAACGFFGHVSKKKYAWIWFGLVLNAFCLWGTFSRGAWVAVAIAVFLFAIMIRNRALNVFLALFLVWAVFFTPPLVKLRMHSLWEKNGGSVNERMESSRESFRMIRQSPWLGLGINTYAKNEPLNKGTGFKIDNQYAHNGYLQMASEIGLTGLFSFLAIFIYFFWAIFIVFQKMPDRRLQFSLSALFFGVLSFLIHSATDTDLHSVLLINMLWLVLGMAWAGRRLALLKKA